MLTDSGILVGDRTVRNIQAQSWVAENSFYNHTDYVFEWSFAHKNWNFYDGTKPGER